MRFVWLGSAPPGSRSSDSPEAGRSSCQASPVDRRLAKGRGDTVRTSQNHTPYRPVMLAEVDLSDELPSFEPATTPDGRPYERLQILIREDGTPLGHLVIDLTEDGLAADELAASVDASFSHRRGASTPSVASGNSTEESVTVVIATRDRDEQLLRCLASLDRQTHANVEVIVVENTPVPSGIEARLSEVSVKGRPPRYRHEPRPGLALAHNAGLELVETELVAFTDDDVEADPRWLEVLVAGFASHPGAGCVTGLIYPASLDHETQYLVEGLGFGKAYERKVFDLESNRPADRLFPFAIGRCGSGANMAYRTDALRKVGGFDSALGTGSPGRGGDDLAAFFDIVHAGYSIVYEPAAIIRHYHDPNPERLANQLVGYGTGLGAYLTRCLVVAPRKFPQFALGIPLGLVHWVRTSQGRAESKRLPVAPRLAGLIKGPPAYLRGRRAARQHGR